MITNDIHSPLFSFHQDSSGFICRISAPLSQSNLQWLKQEIMEEYEILAGDSKKITFVFETYPMTGMFLEKMLFLFSALRSSGYDVLVRSETIMPDFQSPGI